MNTLLKKAFNKADSLPKDEKEAFAAFILEELKQEEKWAKLFKTSGDQLHEMAKEALSEYNKGKTKELDTDKL